MAKRIAIIQGHPDSNGGHLCHSLAEAYARGAQAGGHEVQTITVSVLEPEFLRNMAEWEKGEVSPAIRESQKTIEWANHLVIIYPLWLGTMPALLKAFLEQVLRPGFAFDLSDKQTWKKRLNGRSCRVVVTMGMPALLYRWYFRAHSLRSLERNILRFCGISPVRETLLGMVEAGGQAKKDQWMEQLEALGRSAR